MEDNNLSDEKEDSKSKNEILEWIKTIGLAIILAVFIKAFIFNTAYVVGYSMYPTLEPKDRLISSKIPLYLGEAERFDIVVLEAPDEPGKDYIKRVIGLAGDKVEIIKGDVYINGELLDENYTEEGVETGSLNEGGWLVAKDELFVLGDNRRENASKDSRYFGTIKSENIKGIVNFRYFPINKSFGRLN